jgi:phenylpyruvate tautomerase PptA (4-oxalocrotonate tautomerase family)
LVLNSCEYIVSQDEREERKIRMPYISTKTTAVISAEKREAIKSKVGKAIELIPGKSENWLMLSFDDGSNMYFKGSSEKPLAFVEVKLFGKASADAYSKLTQAITQILSDELSITPDCIYVKYEEVTNWGWNGNNF